MPLILNIEIQKAEKLKSGSLFSSVKATRVEVGLYDEAGGGKWWPVGISDEAGNRGYDSKDPQYNSKLPPVTLRAETVMRFQIIQTSDGKLIGQSKLAMKDFQGFTGDLLLFKPVGDDVVSTTSVGKLFVSVTLGQPAGIDLSPSQMPMRNSGGGAVSSSNVGVTIGDSVTIPIPASAGPSGGGGGPFGEDPAAAVDLDGGRF